MPLIFLSIIFNNNTFYFSVHQNVYSIILFPINSMKIAMDKPFKRKKSFFRLRLYKTHNINELIQLLQSNYYFVSNN